MKKISSNPKEPDSWGYLTRLPLPLLLLLISLGLLFVLLVTIQVHVFRIHQSSRNETIDLHVAVTRKQILLELREIHQQLSWMGTSLTSLCRPCSWNWEYFQSNCYFFSSSQKTWNASLSACKALGAQLVVINSVEEQKFLQLWIAKPDTRIWIGLSDQHKEGDWRWVDRTSLKISFWIRGEPNNDENEDCGELINKGWNDNKCSTKNFWICEKRAAPCTYL